MCFHEYKVKYSLPKNDDICEYLGSEYRIEFDVQGSVSHRWIIDKSFKVGTKVVYNITSRALLQNQIDGKMRMF
jgi:hypothetical protein